MPFITKNLFVNEKCIMYKNECTNNGHIVLTGNYVSICTAGGGCLALPFDEFNEIFENPEQFYRRILFLRFGIPEDPK